MKKYPDILFTGPAETDHYDPDEGSFFEAVFLTYSGKRGTKHSYGKWKTNNHQS